MKVPISWLRDFVDITLPLDELAHRLTMAGLEVEEMTLVGLSIPSGPLGADGRGSLDTKISGLSWEADKIVVAAVSEVMPHPNADRLVLCKLYDGEREHIVLTGAPNLQHLKGTGPLPQPLKVPYARLGARIYDGHQPGQVLTTLKPAKIRGIESYSMICSEKELGISEEHDGIIILDDEAPVGLPLADYIGDAVFDIAILPSTARTASILGVAREVAAITGQPLRLMPGFFSYSAEGPSIEGKASIQITTPELNPRFVLGLIQDLKIGPSPYWMQRRLKLAGMRPINNLVDITNYVMLEIGQPLHAFDYDVLVQRAGGKAPTIITRTAEAGERLTTLDGVERTLNDFSVLVCDTAGALSIAGVMGGAESEVSDQTRNILLEGAAWNYINTRRTMGAQKLQSEAAYRFSRGVHPAMAERGVRRGLELMRLLGGGAICQGLVDHYPLPASDPKITLTPAEVERLLGVPVPVEQIVKILESLEFACQVTQTPEGASILVQTPDHRLDIGNDLIGKADLIEEIARIYGYDRIPETRMADALPPQRNNPSLEREEQVRDLLVEMGLTEIVSYRLTHPDREARRVAPGTPPEDKPYLYLANPMASDRNVLRHSLLSSVLEAVERNIRLRPRLALFEIGPVFMSSEEGTLPDEMQRLAIVMTGERNLAGWQKADTEPMDFYDLKGVLEGLLSGMHLSALRIEAVEHPSFHPGKCARLWIGGQPLGVFGELHPLVSERYDFPAGAVLAAELDLTSLLALAPERYEMSSVPAFPPVLEDLAVVVDEIVPADRVAELIRQAGGRTVTEVRLFDVYRSEQLGTEKKSLAYSLAYQAPDRTLTDKDVAQVRQKIIRRLEQETGAKLRS